jgi:hypothetical protein
MTVNDLIDALFALDDEQRLLPVVFVDDEFGPQHVTGVYVDTRWVELEGPT